MIEFLEKTGISKGIVNIIDKAEERIVLICPYFDIQPNYLEKLERAVGKKGVKVTIVYGKKKYKRNKDLKSDLKKRLEKLNGVEIKYYEELHAKCYYNEKYMVVSSMNLYKYSEQNNREMGFGIEKEIEKELYDEVEEEANQIIEQADTRYTTKSAPNEGKKGYKCDKCGCDITTKVNDYSIKRFNRPLCYEHQPKKKRRRR
jgi:phosphatidylserine/phosphatidylglycerophosphate/cardiolipin synthase-like enzyme